MVWIFIFLWFYWVTFLFNQTLMLDMQLLFFSYFQILNGPLMTILSPKYGHSCTSCEAAT